MDVSKQQRLILEAAMTAPGAFTPTYIVEKTGLAYNIVSPQLYRLVAKKYLSKIKRIRPIQLPMRAGGYLDALLQERETLRGATKYPEHLERTPFRSLLTSINPMMLATKTAVASELSIISKGLTVPLSLTTYKLTRWE